MEDILKKTSMIQISVIITHVIDYNFHVGPLCTALQALLLTSERPYIDRVPYFSLLTKNIFLLTTCKYINIKKNLKILKNYGQKDNKSSF